MLRGIPDHFRRSSRSRLIRDLSTDLSALTDKERTVALSVAKAFGRNAQSNNERADAKRTEDLYQELLAGRFSLYRIDFQWRSVHWEKRNQRGEAPLFSIGYQDGNQYRLLVTPASADIAYQGKDLPRTNPLFIFYFETWKWNLRHNYNQYDQGRYLKFNTLEMYTNFSPLAFASIQLGVEAHKRIRATKHKRDLTHPSKDMKEHFMESMLDLAQFAIGDNKGDLIQTLDKRQIIIPAGIR